MFQGPRRPRDGERRVLECPDGAVTTVLYDLGAGVLVAVDIEPGTTSTRPLLARVNAGKPGSASSLASGWIRGSGFSAEFAPLRWHGLFPTTRESKLEVKIRNDSGADQTVTVEWNVQ